jgi:hypothetical protein
VVSFTAVRARPSGPDSSAKGARAMSSRPSGNDPSRKRGLRPLAVKGGLAALGPVTAFPAHCRWASRVAGCNPFSTGTVLSADS